MLEPVFSQEIFERAMKMTKHTRSFTFKIAAPVSARFLDGKIEATADAVRIMEALASPSVEVTVSMGHQGGFLKRIAPVLSQLWKNSEDEHGHQQVKVSMKGASEDDGEIVEIPDLFADRLIVVVPTQFEGTALTASDRRWAVNNAWNQVREMVKRLYKEE